MFSPKLQLWYVESHKEKNIEIKKIDYSYAIYPKRFYKNINTNNEKSIDFLFIGGLYTDVATFNNRKWIIPFIKKFFNNNSYLQFTDKKTKKNYKILGNYDYTLRRNGMVPKELPIEIKNTFDKNYFNNMSKSKFCLCPAGDSMYSMRFYEALMCKTIPIVDTIEETYRSKDESELDYKFYVTSSPTFIYRKDWVEHNYNLFIEYHTLE